MFKIGQVVQTNRGNGVISSIGDSTPYVYVRLNSGSDEIYVMDRSDLTVLYPESAGYSGLSQSSVASSLEETIASRPVVERETRTRPGAKRLSRRSSKVGRVSSETPIARFVNGRLEELGMKQCEFCRKTGFDQGLLSRIQSSTSSNLSLESCLRLAIGCSVAPEQIFELVGRGDFHGLIMKSYSASTRLAELGADPEVTR